MSLKSLRMQFDESELLMDVIKNSTTEAGELSNYAENQKVRISIVGFGNAGTNMAKNVAHRGRLNASIYLCDTDASHLLELERQHIIHTIIENTKATIINEKVTDWMKIQEFVAEQLNKHKLMNKAIFEKILYAVQHIIKEEGLDDPKHLESMSYYEPKVTSINIHLLGKRLTRGLGTGSDPNLSYNAVLDQQKGDREFFQEIIKNSDMIIVLAGLGGGTGTGAAPAFARLAREFKESLMEDEIKKEPLLISIVTMPFRFEKEQKKQKALVSLSELFKYSHSVIVLENDVIKEVYGKLNVREALRMADRTVAHVAAGLVRMLNSELEFNVDFADLYRLMYDAKMSYIGIGESDANDMAADSVRKALSHPLITKSMIMEKSKAKGAIIFYEVPPLKKIGREDAFTIEKFEEASWIVADIVDDNGMVKWAIDFDVEDTCFREKAGEHYDTKCLMRTLVVIAGVKSEYESLAAEAEKKHGGFKRFIETYMRPQTKTEETITTLFDAL